MAMLSGFVSFFKGLFYSNVCIDESQIFKTYGLQNLFTAEGGNLIRGIPFLFCDLVHFWIMVLDRVIKMG